jgi:2-dehydro-3-deoxy-D-gluconate 5-dehydrogenase
MTSTSSATPTRPDRFRLDGRVALVTGASRGLGAGMAIALAGAGADLVLHASERPAAATAEAIAQGTGRRAVTLTADLADRAAADRLMSGALAAFGRIDILINNAGLVRRQPAATHGDDDWDHVLEVDLSSVFRLCRAAGQHMIERRQGGKIVNIASLLSFQGGITVPGYAAAKGGVMQLTKALANEWAAHGINVNAVAPGPIDTERFGPGLKRLNETVEYSPNHMTPLRRLGQPFEVAHAVLFLASDEASYVTGHTLAVTGGR